MKAIEKNAEVAAGFLKGLASPHRLLILCQLVEGEKNVSALIDATGIAQTSMSQHLAKLREENIVSFRRDHRVLTYFISSEPVLQIMNVLHDNFSNNKIERDRNG